MSILTKIIDASVIEQFMDGCFEGVAVGGGNRPTGNKSNHRNWLSPLSLASHDLQSHVILGIPLYQPGLCEGVPQRGGFPYLCLVGS